VYASCLNTLRQHLQHSPIKTKAVACEHLSAFVGKPIKQTNPIKEGVIYENKAA